MLKLKNVSKFYYNKGIVASGFSKINLELNIGEFVVITGESGSGKSTLLNVISGLDTYEEGEMYINGEETSYYNESDFEEYRKKYIGNIFQNFNLVNSYTVYQNIELIYLMNNVNLPNIKERIYELLKQVDLYKYRNTKVSKLSGGQKQRVAIARALAKETPIIVADEPTGNLDSKSAESVMKLLYEVSKDKLVIIVTHNYEQVEKYTTRKIKMHDGKIIEDRIIEKVQSNIVYKDREYGNISFKQKFKLSFRNTFNIIPKFLLLLLIYSFLSLAVFTEYTSTQKFTYEEFSFGFNSYFVDTSDKRIIINKKDGTPITNLDYDNIKKINNIDYIVENDILIDMELYLTNEDIYIYGNAKEMVADIKLDYGRLPINEHEIIVVGNKYDYYLSDADKILDKELKLNYNDKELLSYNLKIVGIKYRDDNEYNGEIYIQEEDLNNIKKNINAIYSTNNIIINNKKLDDYSSNIYPSNKVKKGDALVSENLIYICKNYYCKNDKIDLTIENIYFKDNITLNITNTYNNKTLNKLTDLKDYDKYGNYIFVNDEDYYSLYNKDNYQSSIYIKDVKKLKDTTNMLNNMGYKTFHVKDGLVDYTAEIRVFTRLISFLGVIIVIIALFFISYFVIKIILKSRNIYFSTIRILGASKKDVKTMLNMELKIVLDISYILLLIFIVLVDKNIIEFKYIKDLIGYLNVTDFIILYIILFIMTILISNRYSKSLFKSSAMKTYREEV